MSDLSTALGSVAAGIGASVFAALGLHPVAVFWAAVGGIIGIQFAAPVSRRRAFAVFIASVLLCSLAGSWIAVHYLNNEPISRNLAACLLAASFHLLINAAAPLVPWAIKGALKKIGIDGGQQ